MISTQLALKSRHSRDAVGKLMRVLRRTATSMQEFCALSQEPFGGGRRGYSAGFYPIGGFAPCYFHDPTAPILELYETAV